MGFWDWIFNSKQHSGRRQLIKRIHNSYRQFRSKLRRWKYFSSPISKGRIDYFGEQVYFPDHCHLIERVLRHPVFEPDLVDAIVKSNGDGCYIDVGANIGLLSIPILKLKKQSVVYSIEPSPTTHSFLKKTWTGSSVRNRWTIEEFIVGVEDGASEFFIHDASMGAFDGVHATHRAGEAKSRTLPMRSLDSYWGEIDNRQVSCIKIDVEGFESSVLKGAKDLVAECKPVIFLEWNAENLMASGVDFGYLLEFCHEQNYFLVAFPNYEIVHDKQELWLRMKFTETFLLHPREN